MKEQYQELPEFRMNLPEQHKHHLLVLVGQMICQYLTAQEGREETTTKTEHNVVTQVTTSRVL
jgi:hypothetical protein